MVKKNSSDITLLLDRTGSMRSIASDVVGGVNQFIEEQKKVEGEATFTLVQFDSQNPYEVVYDHVPMDKVKEFKDFWPRSLTPLLDALGMLIVKKGEKFSKMREEDRPEKIVICVFTDGNENSSKEYTKQQVSEMVKHQSDVYDWKFVFLGADIDAFGEAKGMGIDRGTTSGLNKNKSRQAMGMMAIKVASYRSPSGSYEDLCYNDEDRKELQ